MNTPEVANKFQKIFSIFLLDDCFGRRFYIRNFDGSEIVISPEDLEAVPDLVLDQLFNSLDTQIIFSNGTTELYVQFGTDDEDPVTGVLNDFYREPFI